MEASLASASASAGEFTADDLAAADQLVQLSVSGGGDYDDDEEDHHEAFSSSSARSVNNADTAAAARGEEEHSGGVDRRTKNRYRLVAELYAATREIRVGGGGKSKSKSKRKSSSRDGMRK